MTKIYGHELDLEQSSDGTDGSMWTLVFTQGRFDGPQVSKTVEPVQFVLKKKDYDFPFPKSYYIYYNPYTNKYQMIENNQEEECTDPGYQLGGFIISNCRMMFLNPKCTLGENGTTYIRPFAEEFTQAYEKRQISCNDFNDFCGAFRDDSFTNGFEIDCPILESDSEFSFVEFDDDFTNVPANPITP